MSSDHLSRIFQALAESNIEELKNLSSAQLQNLYKMDKLFLELEKMFSESVLLGEAVPSPEMVAAFETGGDDETRNTEKFLHSLGFDIKIEKDPNWKNSLDDFLLLMKSVAYNIARSSHNTAMMSINTFLSSADKEQMQKSIHACSEIINYTPQSPAFKKIHDLGICSEQRKLLDHEAVIQFRFTTALFSLAGSGHILDIMPSFKL